MIFEDPSRRRWRVAVASFTSLALLGVVLFGLSAAAIMTSPHLPSLFQNAENARTALKIQNDIAAADVNASPKTDTQWKHLTAKHDAKLLINSNIKPLPLTPLIRSGKTLRTAFLLQQDTNSLHSYQANASQLDVVFPDWFFLSHADCTIDARISTDVTNALEKNGTSIFGRLTDGEGDTSYGAQAKAMMKDPAMRTCVAQKLADITKSNGGAGILADIESVDTSSDDNYIRFLIELKQALQAKNLRLITEISSGNQAYDTEYITRISDAVLVLMHGEHYATSASGPLAGQAWFDDTLHHFSTAIPASKLIVGIGSYGMDWTLASSSTAAGLTYGEVMSLASEVQAHPELSPQTRNMVFGYQDEQKRTHTVWFLDGSTAWNQWHDIQQTNALGVAVWRLGSEDPNIWNFIGQNIPSATSLTVIPALTGVYSATRAEVFHIGTFAQRGELSFSQNTSGEITQATYKKLPTGITLERVGSAPKEHTASIAIYGGLDPATTPHILDKLSAEKIPAVFFVYGMEAERYPDMLKLIADRGFMIGNLGYAPGDVSSHDPAQLKSGVNTTQRLIENATNRHSLLFSADAPHTTAEAVALASVQDLGYILVSPNVRYPAVLPAQTNADLAAQLALPERHIIALSGGQDRDAILTALNTVIPTIQHQGVQFVRLDQLMNVSQAALLPAFNESEAVIAAATGFLSKLHNMLGPAVFWILLLTTLFSAMRIVFMSVFVLRSASHAAKMKKYRDTRRKHVSVLIPAYNEAKTIAKTLRSLQASTHTQFEALVIDDGSTDRTAFVVKEFMQEDPRIKLLQKTNGGKASALNLGMKRAAHDIVITIDADTVLLPEAVSELIKPFADPNVDAVCGNVEVGNTHNILTGFQTLEYITAQNFDRRAFDELNAISVVPGATGAWRRQRVLDIGGYQDDTLTEDADLTIRLLANKGKIVYAPEARSKTEAPDNMRDLAKQRFRWSFGTFQCLGKHADLFFKGRVGWIALPNIFIFQILFPLLAPVGDLMFLIALFRGEFSMILLSYAFFSLMDVIGSIFAFILEKKPKKLMLFVLIQRFFYRQFLYIIIIRAIIAMLRGQRYGWNKLQRTGTVAAAET